MHGSIVFLDIGASNSDVEEGNPLVSCILHKKISNFSHRTTPNSAKDFLWNNGCHGSLHQFYNPEWKLWG